MDGHRIRAAIWYGLGGAAVAGALYLAWSFIDFMMGFNAVLSLDVGEDMTVTPRPLPDSLMTAIVFALVAALIGTVICVVATSKRRARILDHATAIAVGAVLWWAVSSCAGAYFEHGSEWVQQSAILVLLPVSQTRVESTVVMLLPMLSSATVLWLTRRRLQS